MTETLVNRLKRIEQLPSSVRVKGLQDSAEVDKIVLYREAFEEWRKIYDLVDRAIRGAIRGETTIPNELERVYQKIGGWSKNFFQTI